MTRLRGSIPIAWMGLANLPFGMYGALVLITVPQLLAARQIPQPVIASITAAAMIPTFCGFLLAPILDVRFSRRSYALTFGALSALTGWFALLQLDSPSVLTACLVLGFLFSNLFYNALGGWLGNLVPEGDEGRLGATFTIGNVAGSALAGVNTVWDISLSMALQMVLGDLVGMAIGFTLGVVLRNSAAAIVGYFVVSLVMPGILVLLAQVRSWFEDLQPWIDWNETQVVLFDGATNTGKEWAMLGSTTGIWIALPLVIGLHFLRRSEVK